MFYESHDFFRQFKQKYALQFIDNSFLDRIEKRKKEILDNIKTDRLTNLYFDTFDKAEIKYQNEDKPRIKSLGSFFSKLVHTFRPEDYCPLDNPIKEFFELKNESFTISFFIISAAYKSWATDNEKIIYQIRKGFQEIDKENKLPHNKITDLKLLDLIFWTIADTQKRQKAKLSYSNDLIELS